MGLVEILSDHTLQTVAIGAAILGAVSGVLGAFAVLRQQSLMGDALSHAALPGICLGFLWAGSRDLGAILGGALAAGALAALTVMAMTRLTRLKTDAALGSVLSFYFALGIVLLTLIQRQAGAGQAGLEAFLFGQAAAILREDLQVMGVLALASLGAVALLWKEFKLVTFDPVFARTLGLPVVALEAVLTVMVAVAVVIGLQMVGVVLMAAMIVAPAVAARQWVTRLGPMVVISAAIGMGAGVTGALISAMGRGLATGPLVVLAASAAVLVSILLAPGRGVIWDWMKRRAERRALGGQRVLTAIHALAAEHGDPEYPAEQSMLDVYFGGGTAAALDRLEARGAVRRAAHFRTEGVHWVLTPQGQAEAEDILAGGEGDRP
ncbi:metal ABC transporter permease [Limibaculum sp. M0105]|uniref:Metal ABC transporter permease n=1 Tax=Thermohalobaculum xanthum TaxID=2753746 RepID=A0A8J7MA65_9RHOB|nr:metal ABC transporter permease [Thermohalobaculum xanthum]MBK0400299.1 metal ABC transporter permease [Thermohalobaculum xanthum]